MATDCDICEKIIRDALYAGVILDTLNRKVLDGYFIACWGCTEKFNKTTKKLQGEAKERATRKMKRYLVITEKIDKARKSCNVLMCGNKIYNRSDYRKWGARGGHPDKGGKTAVFQDVLNCIDKEKYCR